MKYRYRAVERFWTSFYRLRKRPRAGLGRFLIKVKVSINAISSESHTIAAGLMKPVFRSLRSRKFRNIKIVKPVVPSATGQQGTE